MNKRRRLLWKLKCEEYKDITRTVWIKEQTDEYQQRGSMPVETPLASLVPVPYERVDCVIRGQPTIYYIEKTATYYTLFVKRGKSQPKNIFSSPEPFGLIPQLGSEMPRVVAYMSGDVSVEQLHTSLIFLQDGQIAMKYSDKVKVSPASFTGRQILEHMQKFSESDLRRYWAPLVIMGEHVVVRFNVIQEITLQEFLNLIYTAIGEMWNRWESAWKKPKVKRRLVWAKKKELEIHKSKVNICHIDYAYLINELSQVPNDEMWVEEITS